MKASLIRIDNPVRDYAWGSLTALPEALGLEPTGRPQAEMWLGAHPGAPSHVAGSGERLDEVIQACPQLVGAGSRDGGLPFLMKLLAAAQPLSLQVHPDAAQAEAGFARENAAGLALDDPLRSYRDPHHKPEIIVALSDFRALCGFRAPGEALADLSALLGDDLLGGVGRELARALASSSEPEGLRSAFELIMSGRPEVRELAGHAVSAAQGADSTFAETLRILGEHYVDDPGVLGAALLHRIDLVPGEALYLSAGNIHAYLTGLGIEAMAPSDNVLRGGLTPKHVDVPGLLDIGRFEPIMPPHVRGHETDADGVRLVSYYPPAHEFSVHVIEADAGPRTLRGITGPSVFIVSSGRLEASVGDEKLVVERGESVFQAAGEPLTVRALTPGTTAYLTTVGR